MKKERIKQIAAVFVCAFLWTIPLSAAAIPGEVVSTVSLTDLEVWDDGVSVTRQQQDGEVLITADATGLLNEYYTVFLYDYTVRRADGYDGLRFHLRNLGTEALNMNTAFMLEDDVSVGLGENSFAVFEFSDGEVSVQGSSFGTLEIPAGFEGTVYLPFTQLVTESGEHVSIEKVYSFGITVILEKEQQVWYALGDIAFLSESVPAGAEQYYRIDINGKTQIVLPNAGSLTEEYQIKVTNLYGEEVTGQQPQFYLKDKPKGISLTPQGYLEITSECTASEVTVYARGGDSVNAGKLTIFLERLSTEFTQGGIPKPEDVSPVLSEREHWLTEMIPVLRWTAGLVALILCSVFYSWFAQARQNRTIIQKQLYRVLGQSEEEDRDVT